VSARNRTPAFAIGGSPVPPSAPSLTDDEALRLSPDAALEIVRAAAPSAVQEEAPSRCSHGIEQGQCFKCCSLPAAAPVEGAIPTEPTIEQKLDAIEQAVIRVRFLESKNARLLNELAVAKSWSARWKEAAHTFRMFKGSVLANRVELSRTRRELAGYREAVDAARASVGTHDRNCDCELCGALGVLASLSPTPGEPK
jgi:hypothetical protein